MIDPDQLTAKAVKAASKAGKPKAKKKTAKPKPKKAAAKPQKAAEPKVTEPQAAKPATAQQSYSIAEFAGLTYLTEKGVAEWLKLGRLSGSQDAQGAWRIDAANLEASIVKRLVR